MTDALLHPAKKEDFYLIKKKRVGIPIAREAGWSSVTRAYFEIVEFINENMGKILKRAKIVLRNWKFM